MVAPCRQAVADCRRDFPDEKIPAIRGSVLIWDDHLGQGAKSWPTWPMNSIGWARPERDDPEVTVCLLVSSTDVESTSYVEQLTGKAVDVKGFETHFEVCVVHWPSLEPMGRFTAIGKPRSQIKRKAGDSTSATERWDHDLAETILSQLRSARTSSAPPREQRLLAP